MTPLHKLLLAIPLSALAIAALLHYMMVEVHHSGLTVWAVALGLGAVGVLQAVSIYCNEVLREMPPIKFWRA